ncbi:dihydrolipoamide acetyltransferase family protein [Candidatus Binatus sp.]|uniref:dihydrolipoamide acetyltransferase family protein n=2 Tax=Candidatus Binatus sp. TaxID=2811406 RepID=UPI003C6680DC
MSNEITMPKLSDTMEEGKILRWLKHPGDKIARGEAIAEVETDKADMVLESFEEGVLDQIKLNEGESAPVGAVIALMKSAGAKESKPQAKSDAKAAATGESKSRAQSDEKPATLDAMENPGAEAAATPDVPKPVAIKPKAAEKKEPARKPISPAAVVTDGSAGDLHVHPAMSANLSAAPTAIAAPPPRPEPPKPAVDDEAGDGHKLRASPLARRAAEEAGIDITHVRGTGPDGRVTKRDVDNFLREQQLFKFRRLVSPREGAPGSREELSAMRKTIAKRMALSKREIPHFYVTVEVAMEDAVRLKDSLEATELFEETVTYNDIIVKACALALGRYPRINASYEDDGIVIHPNVNIGVAVAVEDGLILPVIHGCERLSLLEISRAAHRLVAKSSRGGFTSDELSGATFSISNMGMLGIEHFAAVIVPPQAAILAVSAIKDRPVVRNGQLAVGKTMMMTGSFDHRIVDGVVAGRFLQELKRFLENPSSLLL